jgi:hypothetical protein
MHLHMLFLLSDFPYFVSYRPKEGELQGEASHTTAASARITRAIKL